MQSHFNFAMRRILAQAGLSRQVAIALSGGLDSMVLLDLCVTFAKNHPIDCIAFHVHHGLSLNADYWTEYCQQRCAELDIPFEAARVHLKNTNEQGIEAAARTQRYAALGELCQRHQTEVLLTAHHQDDQAETVLLQLLRGTGVAGLSGIQLYQYAAGLLGTDKVLLARPLLDCTRAQLENYAKQRHIQHIEDESNANLRYTRNALRHQIMPLFEKHFPGYQTRFARSAQHAQTAQKLLEELTEQDYVKCFIGFDELNIIPLQQLSEARIDNVLRYWLAQHQVKMPSKARLTEMRKQLLHAREDAQVSVQHGALQLHRYRQRLSMAHNMQLINDVQDFVWKGEASLRFPTFSGTLFFDPVEPHQPGINRTWLLKQLLQLRPRQGGERLKLAANRPHRSIKNHYQTNGIPYWQRRRLPFVFVGDKLLYAAGVAVNGDFQEIGTDSVTLRWQAD